MDSYAVIGKNGQEIQTNILLHPGEILSSEIEARGILKSEMAEALGIKPGNLTELFKGKRHFSALLALKIEALIGIEASFWLRLQSEYDLGIAKQDFTKAQYSKLTRKSQTFKKKIYS